MKGGTDLEYARKVAEHIGSEHTEIIMTEEEGLSVLEDVVRCCETFDITTIRASVGQHLIAKWISKNTDIKVVLNGDGSDEAWMGYLYSHLAPSSQDLYEDSTRLINYIHYFDGLRVDRNISYWGLEARLPFLDKKMVELSQSLSGELRMPQEYKGKNIEKYILRRSFDVVCPNLLP
jgi:asparagine synthase (glutamine-hydrolysing)